MFINKTKIRYSEADCKGLLRIDSIVNYFQDGLYCLLEELDFGEIDLLRTNVGWFTKFWQINIFYLPHINDEVAIEVVPYEIKKAYIAISFCVKDMNNRDMIIANSIWMLVKLSNLEICRIPNEIKQKLILSKKIGIERISCIIDDKDCKYVKKTKVICKKSQLDTNLHMNNAEYIRLALDNIDIENVNELHIEYRKQILVNNEINILFSNNAKSQYVKMCSSNNDVYAVLKFS